MARGSVNLAGALICEDGTCATVSVSSGRRSKIS